jgi:hemerythrin superfamily protein
MTLENTDEDDDRLALEPGASDAIDMLTSDHEDVKLLFAEYEELAGDGGSAEEREELARYICDALTVHTTVEEEVFYPAARDAIDEPELLDRAVAEHRAAKALIAQILAMNPADSDYDATVQALQEAVDQHVHEEEEQLFPRVQEAGIDLRALGEQMAERKEQAQEELDEADAQ